MKSFREHLRETQETFDRPATGDDFAINIREECLIETYVVDETADGIVLHADERMMRLLESYGYVQEGGVKEMLIGAAERMTLDEFIDAYGSQFGPDEAEEFWHTVNDENEVEQSGPGHWMHEETFVAANSDGISHQDAGEYDYEGDMAKDDLSTIIRAARRLTGMLDDNENMPEWVQSKINKAADYVDTAADYIESNKERGVMEGGDPATYRAKAQEAHAKYLKYEDLVDQELRKLGERLPRSWDANAFQNKLSSDPKYAQALKYYKLSEKFGGLAVRYKELSKKRGMAEGQLANPDNQDSPVARAITHRILMQHTGLLAKYGPERVMDAVDEVADFVGDVEEIGSSDVSGWVRHVEQMLTNMPDSLDEQYGDEFDNEEDEEDEANGFYVVIASETNGVFIGQVIKDGSKWREMGGVGKQPYSWGGNYMGYLSPDDVISWIRKDYRNAEVDGPFSSEDEAQQAADNLSEAKYQGREVPLGKPMQGDVKKSKVYVRGPKGNVVKVNFGDPNMRIKKSNPERRKNFRARHNCDNPGPRWKARYWSCRAW